MITDKTFCGEIFMDHNFKEDTFHNCDFIDTTFLRCSFEGATFVNCDFNQPIITDPKGSPSLINCSFDTTDMVDLAFFAQQAFIDAIKRLPKDKQFTFHISNNYVNMSHDAFIKLTFTETLALEQAAEPLTIKVHK